MRLFYGSGVALVTPFLNNKVDFNQLKKLIEWHIAEFTDALIVCGTTGESATLTIDEKKEIFDFTVKLANKRIPVFAGTGSNCTESTVELSKYAASVGVDGLLLVTPYYNKPTQRGLYAHFKKVHDEVNIPIILYNVPSRTGVNLLPETVFELSQLPNIKAIKEASGDISQIAKVIDLCDKKFIVYSGNDDQIIPILSLGGKGVISVTANILPREIHRITKEFILGNKNLALESFLKLRSLNQVLFIESNPVPVKTAMNLMGINVGTCRLPLVEMEEKNINILKGVMKDYGLL